MTSLLPTWAARAVRRCRGVGRTPARGEDGFILLESLVAISLITVILAALGTLTLQTTKSTTDLRARQAAAQVATSTMASVAALPPTDLITGRDAGSVSDQLDAAQKAATAATVYPALRAMVPLSDVAATARLGATAAVPTSAVPQVLNAVAYSVNTYIGSCVIATGASSCTAAGLGLPYLRIVVAVTWTGRGCSAGGTCAYVTSQLVNTAADPVFNTNTAVPPAAPVVSDPDDQVSTVGGTVSLQLAVNNGSGAGSLTWAVTSGRLPDGLTLSASGLVSGVPTTTQAATPLTVTATDAFGRTGSDTFTWKVVAPPTIATPASQTSTQGSAVRLAPTYTCPNTPCGFTLANAPAGLSINATTGVITGTPTTPGTSASVTVTITDAASVSATTAAFSWKVFPKPTIADPGTLSVTVKQTVAVPIALTCPTATCTVTLANSVPGLGLAAAASTTALSTTSLSVTSSQTTVYVTGVVQPAAVTSGTSTTWTPALTITDANTTTTSSANGTWTAYAGPTIAALAARTTTVKSTPNVGLAWSCPVSSCTITLTGTVPGVGLSTTAGVTTANSTTSVTVSGTTGTIYYTGLVSGSAVPSGRSADYNPQITITDSGSVSAATTATWTISSGPTLTNPGTQVVQSSKAFSLTMSSVCSNTPCSYTLASTAPSANLPSINATTGRITWTPTTNGAYTFTVTVTDSLRLTDTVSFTVRVSPITVTMPNFVSSRPSSGSRTATLDLNQYVSPAADGYSFAFTNAPAWLSIDSSTGIMTAIISSNTPSPPNITLVVTSTSSPSTTGSDTFSWTMQ